MKQTHNYFNLKDVCIIWILVLGSISIIGEAAKASRAFYERVILNDWKPYKIRIVPDSFRPCEGLDFLRNHCSTRKTSAPQLPQGRTV